jgi:hypothetical protein
MLLAEKLIELDIIILSEFTQIEKGQDCVFSLICEDSPER